MAEATTSRYATSASDKQKAALNKLLKDPSKPVFIPSPPKEKTIRPPREMMKNVQGSSAGAGSGEFHVYKANRRREYERIKLMEEQSQKEVAVAEFEKRQKEWQDEAEAKTSRNRARRQKKRERAVGKRRDDEKTAKLSVGDSDNLPVKKRRLVNEAALHLFRSDEDNSREDPEDDDAPNPVTMSENAAGYAPDDPLEANVGSEGAPRLTIHED